MLSGQRFPILRSLSQEASLYAPQLIGIVLPLFLGFPRAIGPMTCCQVVKLTQVRMTGNRKKLLSGMSHTSRVFPRRISQEGDFAATNTKTAALALAGISCASTPFVWRTKPRKC